ncbi:amidohydrolase [Myxococcota bacterium]|nr:amidohydrolase [Myxococcota bacterium]
MSHSMISADSHVFEPGDLWETRVDANLRDRVPKVEQLEAGSYMVFDDGTKVPFVGFGSAGDRGRTSTVMPLEDVRRGGYDPSARLADMDRDGLAAEVLYPSFAMRLFTIQDPTLQAACMRVYNDWLAEFQSAAPDRLLGQALLPVDVDAALAELDRISQLGFRGVVVSGHPTRDHDYGTDLFEKLWAALEEAHLPASLHVFTGPHRPERNSFLADYTLATGLVARSLALMVFTGVFERYPELRIVSAENDIGWVAHLLLRMDHAFERKGPRYSHPLRSGMKPSEQFRRNVRCTFMDDRAGVLTLEIAGPELFMWASDYPHDDSTFPESRKVVDRLFEGIAKEQRQMIVHDNAARLFGLV